MKRKLFTLIHQIAVKVRTHHSLRLRKWTELDNKVCSGFISKRDNGISKEAFDELIDAADIVCGECLYRSERTCNKCPVRKTMDRTEAIK